MSNSLSSKQFKQDINSLFSKLHSVLEGLEAKIIERDESLREEVRQEILANLSIKDDKVSPGRKSKNAPDFDKTSANPVSMVVPVDPSQFIGTTIKHTSNYINNQSINATIKEEASSNSVNTKNTSNCHVSTIASNNSHNLHHQHRNNNNSKSTINSNNSHNSRSNSSHPSNDNEYNVNDDIESNSSRQGFDSQDEPFKTINNSNSSNFNNSNIVPVPSSGSSSSSTTTIKENNNRVKENRCPMCAQRFTQLNSLKRHIRSHTGERPFPCGYCDKRFVDRERLKVHVRIHTGEKPFSCNLCSRRFSQKSTVKRHMSVHTGLKPFQCGSCSKRFGTRDNLRVHEKSHFQVDFMNKLKGINNNQVQPDNLNYV